MKAQKKVPFYTVPLHGEFRFEGEVYLRVPGRKAVTDKGRLREFKASDQVEIEKTVKTGLRPV